METEAQVFEIQIAIEVEIGVRKGKIPDPGPGCTGVDPDPDPDFDGIAPWAIKESPSQLNRPLVRIDHMTARLADAWRRE